MTKQNPVAKYGVAAIADVLSLFGIPTATAMTLYQDVLDKRSAEALEILMSEIRQGNFENVDQNEIVSTIARFQRDAMEGVARKNLKLMARVINGMAVEQELQSSTFYRYANILASLSADEITVLGVMAKYMDTERGTHMSPNSEKGVIEYTNSEAEELAKTVPHYQAIQQALVRTGLLFFTVAAEASSNNPVIDGMEISPLNTQASHMLISTPIVFTITPLMREILKYIPHFDLEDK